MKKLKLKKGDRVWVNVPQNAVIKSVNQKIGYTLILDEIKNGTIAQYFSDKDVNKLN